MVIFFRNFDILKKHIDYIDILVNMKFDPESSFDNLPLLPPKAEIENAIVLKECIKAHKELSKLNMACKLIPNQTVLINSIPLLESQASSLIENIVTTTDELFQFSNEKEVTDSSIKETLRYRTALYMGVHCLKNKPLSLSLICDICSMIRGVNMDVRKVPGTTLINDKTGQKIYTPPSGNAHLRDLLTNWQNYIHTDDSQDLLVKLAIQHYQFEAIHPFIDGNGRTGRIINLLFLVEKGLLEKPILYLSRYINNHKSEYYEKLLRVTTHGDWQGWVLYMLEAIRETSMWTTNRILAIQELIKTLCIDIQKKAPSIYSKELVEILFNQPYTRIANVMSGCEVERQTASKYLKILTSIGFLKEMHIGREKLFINKQFINLLKAK